MSKRPHQINIVDREAREALDEILKMCRPEPSITSAVRTALCEYRDSLKSKIAAQERRKQ